MFDAACGLGQVPVGTQIGTRLEGLARCPRWMPMFSMLPKPSWSLLLCMGLVACSRPETAGQVTADTELPVAAVVDGNNLVSINAADVEAPPPVRVKQWRDIELEDGKAFISCGTDYLDETGDGEQLPALDRESIERALQPCQERGLLRVRYTGKINPAFSEMMWRLATVADAQQIPRRILDLGTGSGILGMAAAKLLHRKVLATDIEPWSVRVAAENGVMNGLRGLFRAELADGWRDPVVRNGRYDLVFANILARPLCAMARDLATHLRPGGTAILAGLLGTQVRMVLAAHRRCGLVLERRIDLGQWSTLVLRKR